MNSDFLTMLHIIPTFLMWAKTFEINEISIRNTALIDRGLNSIISFYTLPVANIT